MAGPQSATLVLGHTFSDRPEVVTDLIAQPVTIRVVRWAETKVSLAFEDDRRETDVPVECETCGELVVAHLLNPHIYRQRRLAWLATGLTIIAIQVAIVVLFVWETLDGDLPPAWGIAFAVAMVTIPVGFIVASFGAGQLTDVPRGRKPSDGIHSFRVDNRP
jgi:hypothetical protein